MLFDFRSVYTVSLDDGLPRALLLALFACLQVDTVVAYGWFATSP